MKRKTNRSKAGMIWLSVIPAALWAIWKSRNDVIFKGMTFYYENLWESTIQLIKDQGTGMGGFRSIHIGEDACLITK
ncbi:hypothetical protein QJS04_geneDACA002141 [Acorus gramineus]|uniref:Uncharacterized protein n=1 Tax=Acorus gramineus TaxID=55184 RepID=A0AAV9A8C0_ACOGR|nr:hypothetical protein QJS04_geneDACA002141 [Acorus gramineus]